MMREVFVFRGPTGAQVDVPTGGAAIIHNRPPAVRGDIETIVSSHQPGTIVLVDGVFHSEPAVGHVELREAIRAGWTVWGLCSMGAIRAAEMRHLGVLGFGRVFRLFAQPDGIDDDEVALHFAPFPPYAPLTEPLLHLRLALRRLAIAQPAHRVRLAAAEKVLKQRWFGERTLETLFDLLVELPHSKDDLTKTVMASRIKDQDWSRFVAMHLNRGMS